MFTESCPPCLLYNARARLRQADKTQRESEPGVGDYQIDKCKCGEEHVAGYAVEDLLVSSSNAESEREAEEEEEEEASYKAVPLAR